MPPPPPPPLPRPPPPLMDELVEEVLLRLPPDSPASLVRAGLVCKRWCLLVSDTGFQRRFIEFHRRAPPPMVGFLVHSHHRNEEGGVFHTTTTSTRFVPMPGGSSLPHSNNDLHGLRPCDSRHGRVLLRPYLPGERGSFPIIVWNPITGEQLKLSNPPGWYHYHWTAAVLCAATTTGLCDHLDCHHGPFVVVLVGNTWYDRYTSIYSTEAGVWSKPTIAPHSNESVGDIASSMRRTLIGNLLYIVLEGYRNILDYNLCTRETSVIKLPRAGKNTSCERNGPIQLTTMEDGRLGLVRVEDYLRLCLWSWSRENGEIGWVLKKVIELQMLLPLDDRRPTFHYLVGSVEAFGIIFLTFQGELFTVDLRSGQVTKVYTLQRPCFTKVVVPYVSFCTPVFRAPFTLDGPRTSTSQSTGA